ncbi:MAG: rRNA maturation RNase YbeY [Candidatus Marinamargulisbacteria bacterium]
MIPSPKTPKLYVNNEQTDMIQLPISVDRFAREVIAHLQLDVDYIDLNLMTAESIQALNAKYFDANVPTDTISFNLTPDDAITGDIYLCPSIIQDNARQYDNSFSNELKTVIIHSILHLTGMTDETPTDFLHMKKTQDTILKALK